MLKELRVSTRSQSQMLDITGQVSEVVAESGIKSGVCYVFVPHTTAGVTINENADPCVVSDILTETDKIVPWKDGYKHMEGNSAAHIKASLMGFCQTVLVECGKLILGTWQGIYFCEFDGPRNRKVFIKIMEA
ncbi:MAG: hypothetical protein CVU89_04015 [Firmicutes bacterium HGW-Firmicutes-14]|nr:MAG: hypothetical protein CVU89_04015 [Firmicutes bacterium HGW-Firmicutes-14]